MVRASRVHSHEVAVVYLQVVENPFDGLAFDRRRAVVGNHRAAAVGRAHPDFVAALAGAPKDKPALARESHAVVIAKRGKMRHSYSVMGMVVWNAGRTVRALKDSSVPDCRSSSRIPFMMLSRFSSVSA